MTQTLLPPSRSKSKQASSSYSRLLAAVRQTFLEGQNKIERQKVLTYWETGRLIQEHILKNKERADYGEEIIPKLSKDIEVSETVLRRCLKFHRHFPIPATWPELTWSHFRALIAIPDKETRLELAERANRSEWSVGELSSKIRRNHRSEDGRSFGTAASAVPKAVPFGIKPKRGTVGTYQMLDPVHIDLGFSTYFELPASNTKKFKEGDIVEAIKRPDGTYSLDLFSPGRQPKDGRSAGTAASAALKAVPLREEALYTYSAALERVIDGDTLKVKIDLGFGVSTRQILRLRGIDCPELSTAAGKNALDFARRELSKAGYLIIRSSRSDKYDRYLADIWYQGKGGEKFLNNELLTHDFAVNMGS